MRFSSARMRSIVSCPPLPCEHCTQLFPSLLQIEKCLLYVGLMYYIERFGSERLCSRKNAFGKPKVRSCVCGLIRWQKLMRLKGRGWPSFCYLISPRRPNSGLILFGEEYVDRTSEEKWMHAYHFPETYYSGP